MKHKHRRDIMKLWQQRQQGTKNKYPLKSSFRVRGWMVVVDTTNKCIPYTSSIQTR